jgi:hypothetical protein
LSPLAVTDVLTGMITSDSDSSRPGSSSQIYLLYRDLTTGTCFCSCSSSCSSSCSCSCSCSCS